MDQKRNAERCPDRRSGKPTQEVGVMTRGGAMRANAPCLQKPTVPLVKRKHEARAGCISGGEGGAGGGSEPVLRRWLASHPHEVGALGAPRPLLIRPPSPSRSFSYIVYRGESWRRLACPRPLSRSGPATRSESLRRARGRGGRQTPPSLCHSVVIVAYCGIAPMKQLATA